MARKKKKAPLPQLMYRRSRGSKLPRRRIPPQSAVAAAGATSVGGVGLLALGSSLSIREVGERAAQFKALIAAGSAEVDAGKLESIDTAGLQLLLAAAAAARRRGLTLRLHGAGGLSSGAASALGLADHLASDGGDTAVSAGDNPARGAPAAPEHSEPSASANVKFAGELRRFLELGAAQLDAAMRESDSRVDKLAGAVTAVATDARELEMQVQALESADPARGAAGA